MLDTTMASNHAKYAGAAIYIRDGLNGALTFNRSTLQGGTAWTAGGVYIGARESCDNMYWPWESYSMGPGSSLAVRPLHGSLLTSSLRCTERLAGCTTQLCVGDTGAAPMI